MLLLAFLAWSFVVSSFAEALNTTLYKPLFQPHSNSTPVFKNLALIQELSSGNKSILGRRDATDLPTGTCAPGTPCTNGACCSNTGVCSYAPSSCSAEYCISNCDAKAPCGEYADPNNATCPLNVCCSQYGFCGTTDDFCGTGCQTGYGDCGPANTPSCAGTSASSRTIGYYESWASTRVCDTRTPEDIDLTGLTHINFAFAFFNPTSFQVSPMDANSATLYSRFTNLKTKKPSLKTWISIGGWSFNDDTNSPNTRTAFSDMVSSSANRQTFITALTSFMVTYGFDGVDIDWEYPGADDRGGVAADTANYVSLVQELRAAFGSNYGITATVPSSFWYLQNFDINSMQNYLDWFNFMSYDIHGIWDSSDKFTGPYIRPHTNLTEIEDGLSLMWRAGVDPAKVVLGLGWYGRSFTLTDPSCSTPNGVCEFSAGGNPGQCTNSAGTLSNAEILRIIAAGGAVESYDSTAAVKWITWNSNQWVSFDDGETMQQKIEAANNLCLGGIMIWSIDQDNTNGDSMSDLLGVGTASGATEAEAQSYKDQLNNATLQKGIAASCYWSLCGDTCQSGYFDVTEAKGQVSGVQQNSVCSNGDYQTLCCAPGTIMGTCQWEGWKGVGMPCSPVCNDTSATIIAQNSNSYYEDGDGLLQDLTCTGGYQAYCCTGFVPSTKTNTGDLFLYGQGVFSKRDLAVIEKRGNRGATIGVLTAAACAAAILALIAAAPFTFGLSLLGIPEEVQVCVAAGIAVAATGFVAVGTGSSQPNPNGSPAVNEPRTGVPTTVGTRSSYGQWPLLNFGSVSTKGCDCFVTYSCRYGLGWDEVCDNQRWAMDVMFKGQKSVFSVLAAGRAPNRKQRLWAQSHSAAFRTLVQGSRSPPAAQCEVDEFPMGNLADSGNNNPQACRLVNGDANGAQGNDYKAWKSAQWNRCSSFRKTICKSKDPPPATWAFGPLNGNRGQVNGKHFINAYGYDSQTVNALCFASYTFTGADNSKSNTMVSDHGFRGLLDDPMFSAAFGWKRQNWLVNPAPKASSNQRPTSMNSANNLKRDLQEFLDFEYDDEDMSPEELEAYLISEGITFEDLNGNAINPEDCDILYDDYSESTVLLANENGFMEVVTVTAHSESPMTSVNVVSPTTMASSKPKATLAGTFPAETGTGSAVCHNRPSAPTQAPGLEGVY